MKLIVTLVAIIGLALSGKAQNTPYNPDADDNQLINSTDLGSFLAVYGGPFFSEDDDTDITNELQTLYLNGDTLGIVGGNEIILNFGEVMPVEGPEPGPIETYFAGQMGYLRCWATCRTSEENGSTDWNMLSIDDAAFSYNEVQAIIQSAGGCWVYIPKDSPLTFSYGSTAWNAEAPILDWDPGTGEIGALTFPSSADFGCYCSKPLQQ
jgi:hypothetical protein